MVEIIISVLLLVCFLALCVFAVRGGNLMMGLLLMAVAWTMLPLLGNALVTTPAFIEANKALIAKGFTKTIAGVFQGGPEVWGPVLVNFFFGAWFGRVMLETGIATTIIRKTVELGGDKPAITTILLSVVTAGVFTSMFGTGAVIAIGVIVLPILLSLGVPKVLALLSFMMSIGAGLYINPVIFNQYQAFYLDAAGKQTYFYDMTYLKWGFIALAVQLLITIIIIIVMSNRKQTVHAWAAQVACPAPPRHAPGMALITPFVPVFLAVALQWPVIAGFLIAAFYALWVCGILKSFENTTAFMSKTFYDGVVDTAPLVGFMLCVAMFNKSAELCVPYFNALLGDIIPRSTLIVCIAFALLAPLGLFRGPLTLAGAGAAALGILKSLGFPTLFLFPLLYAPTVSMNISACITQSWIVWGLSYSKVETTDFLKLSIPTAWTICIILSAVTYVMFG